MYVVNRMLPILLILFLLSAPDVSATNYAKVPINIVTPTNSTYIGSDPYARYLPLSIEVNEKLSGPISYNLNKEGRTPIQPLFLLNQSSVPSDLSSFSNPVDSSSIFCDDQKCIYNESAVLIIENTPALDSMKDGMSISFKNVNFPMLRGYATLVSKEECWKVSLDFDGDNLVWQLWRSGRLYTQTSNSKISAKKLYNLTFDYNGFKMRIFINSKLDAVSEMRPGPKIDSAPTADIYIGGGSSKYRFDGTIGGVSIFNQSMTLSPHIKVLNPSFEDDVSTDDRDEPAAQYPVAHWRQEGIQGSPKFSTTEDARTGKGALLVQTNSNERAYYAQNPNQYKPDVVPGKWYNMSVYYKAERGGKGGVRIQYLWWDKNWKCFGAAYSRLYTNNHTNWHLISINRTAPDRAAKGDWVLEVLGEGTVVWDDVFVDTNDELQGVKDGANELVLYANDVAKNTVYFTVDTGSPRIEIKGITNGARYNTNVVPTVIISDATLSSSSIELNGRPYTSGAAITADGDYLLSVSATDSFGNLSMQTVTFTIDETPPEITIQSPNKKTYHNSNIWFKASAIDATSSVDAGLVEIDGVNCTLGYYNSSMPDGTHTAKFYFNDSLGNLKTKTVTFNIDTASPPLLENIAPAVAILILVFVGVIGGWTIYYSLGKEKFGMTSEQRRNKVMRGVKKGGHLLPIIALIVVSTLFMTPYLQNPELGYDTNQHIAKSVYLSRHLPYVEWHKEWHFGRPFLLHYPPLTYYLIALFSLVLPHITAYSLVVLMAFVLNPIVLYLLLKEWGLDKIVAFASALLLLTSWTYLGTIYVRGELPYMLGCALVLLLFLSLERTKSLRGEIISGMVLAAVICTHLHSALILIILTAPYILVNPKKIPYKELIRSVRVIMLVGISLSSLFWVPFIISLLENEMYMGKGLYIPLSIKEIVAWPSSFYGYYYFIGYPIVILMFVTVYSMSVNPKYKQNRHLIIAGMWTILLYLMMKHSPLRTVRYLFFIAITSTLCSSYALEFIHYRKKGIVYVLMIGFLVFGSFGTFKMTKGRDVPFYSLDDDAKGIADYLQSVADPNEVVVVKDPFVSPWFNAYTDIPQSGGQSIEGAINWDLGWALVYADHSEMKELMREIGARYIVVESKNLKGYLEQGFVDVFHPSWHHLLLLKGVEPSFVVGKNLIVKSVAYDDPDHISIDFKGLEKNKTLVVKTSYHRGWKAYLDGERIQVQKSMHGFIELHPDAVGEHRIELRYSLFERKIGFLLSYMSLVVIMGHYVLKMREEGPFKRRK